MADYVALTEWITTFGLIFGGCCSNAWALEVATSQNPNTGTLITFAQFLLVSAYGLWKHVTLTPVATGREEVLRTVASDIAKLCSGARKVRVGIEGVEDTLSDAFADELEGEVKMMVGDVHVERVDVHARDVDVPARSVVLVSGAQGTGWDYTVRLSYRPDGSTTHPVVVYPVPPLWRRVRLKERSIPISSWGTQVVLFLMTSLLNNAAFGYRVPMGVHIIFRSGGLVVNMLMGWLIAGRRYNATQVLSVIMVTLGVVCTTLSASGPSRWTSPGQYGTGILILTLALIMSGFMGLAQDRAYAKYGRGHWQEAMFYLHILALPGFTFVWRDLAREIGTVNGSTRVSVWGTVTVPSFYIPLVVNVATQLGCVSGVHRLTSRVNSVTVTLALVVRKAVSLGISVVVMKKGGGRERWLWGGAGLVLGGSVGYTLGGTRKARNGTKRE